jgi:CHAT domain-containing protein
MIRRRRDFTSLAAHAVLATLLAAYAAAGQTPGEPQALLPNQTLEREMTGAQTHRYTFDLRANEFFQTRVEQKGVDVTLKLTDAGGNVLATMDSPNSKQGPETLSFVASQAGAYTLELSSFDAKAEKGNYSIHREESRAAMARDKRRVEVERLFVEGMTASGAQGWTETAVGQLSAARAGWTELGDGYMADLTAQQAASVTLQDLNKTLRTAQSLLAEGQKLSVKSKSDSSAAKAKLDDVLAMCRDLNVKLNDKALLERISQSGAASKQLLDFLKAQRFFSKQAEGISLNALAQTYYNLGELEEHAAYLKLSIAAYEDAIKLLADSNIADPNKTQGLLATRGAVAGSLLSLGGTLNSRLGEPKEALKYLGLALEQVRALYQETQDPRYKVQEALILQMTGLAYAGESKDRKTSIGFFSKAIEIYRTLPDGKPEVAKLLSFIGGLYSLDFDYEEALKNSDAALEIYRELDNKSGQLDVLLFKGTMYHLLDDKPKVRETIDQALLILQSPEYAESFKKQVLHPHSNFEVFDELGEELFEQTRLDRIGFSYQLLEDYGKAIEYYEKALAVTRARKDPDAIRGELRSLGFIYTKLEKWDKAYEYYKQSLEISRGRDIRENIADDLADVGWTLLESGKLRDALAYQDEALALYQTVEVSAKSAFSTRYSPLLNELARTHAALGNRRMAIFYGKQGVNAIQDERRRLGRKFDAETQKGFLGKQEKHYRRLANWLIEEGRLPEAEQVLAMLKEDEVLSYLRRDASETDKLQRRADLSFEERDALTRYNAIAERIAAIGAEYDKLLELKRQHVELSDEQSRRFDELSKESQDANHIFQAFLKQLADEFAARANVKEELSENQGLKRDLKKWGEGCVFLYTLVGEDRYRVILTTTGAQTDGKYEIKAEALNEKIEKFREAVKNPAIDPRPLGKELYDILIKPIEKQLDGAKAKTLLWSLDGNLRLLPLAALWDGQQYFGQKYQNVTVTLASRTRLGEAVTQGWRALGLGVTQSETIREPNGTRDIPFKSLPAVRTELASIVRNDGSPDGVLPGQILLDTDFNETKLKKELLNNYQVIHIASHFSLNPGDATKSFLVMGNGQILTVDELKTNEELSFGGVELLTLSACDTAVVEKDSSGKEIEGFGYVAQQKGAKAILATLWSVADESTSLLMSEFYRLRKENPRLTKAEALQMAQREMIDGKLSPAAGSAGGLDRGAELAGDAQRSPDGPKFSYDKSKPYAHPYFWSPFVLIGNWK